MGSRIIVGDVLDPRTWGSIPDSSIHCICTSPPFWGLRDYGTATWEGGDPGCNHTPARPSGDSKSGLEGAKNSQGHRKEGFKGGICLKCGAMRVDDQIGLEKTPEEYVSHLVQVFQEMRRVLHPSGVIFLNLGDSYTSGGRSTYDSTAGRRPAALGQEREPHPASGKSRPPIPNGLKTKDLVGIPWMVAFALRADGWWLRSEIIWSKPNPMPESVTDRPSKNHETIFLLAKNKDYFFDAEAIKEQNVSGPSDIRNRLGERREVGDGMGRNRRTVWEINTVPCKLSHFAVFPPSIPLLCVKAGTSEKGCCKKCGAPIVRKVERIPAKFTNPRPFSKAGNSDRNDTLRMYEEKESRTIGWEPSCKCRIKETIPSTVLDPFSGSGTTIAVADFLGRHAIGIELSRKNADLFDARRAEVIQNIIGGDPKEKIEFPDGQMTLFGGENDKVE